LPSRFVIASAGAGKTTTLVGDALEAAEANRTVLILTYTRNNQVEVIKKIREVKGHIPDKIRVKGWFSFLLEEIIRPYQRCFFDQRISNVQFDVSDPHKRDRYSIPGRAEIIGGRVNSRHYLVNGKAHTTYISKLAVKICQKRKQGRGRAATYDPIQRLSAIYDLIIIDEVQDLVGWDFSLIELILSSCPVELLCVGDFRQTIYQTSHATKNPRASLQKKQWFLDKNFECIDENHSYRCIQMICNLADLVHANEAYKPTVSRAAPVPDGLDDHVGAFSVREEDFPAYMDRYNPIILRWDVRARPDLCSGHVCQNFGESKGSTYDRVLILPTTSIRQFLLGNFGPIRSSEKALNKLYVAITRARYSVAFLTNDASRLDNLPIWHPAENGDL